MNTAQSIQLHESWLPHLREEFDQPYMIALKQFLKSEKQAGKIIFPKGAEIFNALNTTPLDKVKVVILGQDPYHGPNQAHGLCFSVKPGVVPPPSLKNIYKEIQAEYGCAAPSHGYLMPWAEQGVLLLNSVLTVEQFRAASHQKQGWEQFTDKVIQVVNDQCENVVFLLWGGYAQKKGTVIDQSRHCVLQSPHPSPLSAHRGFLGNNHFKKADQYLQEKGKSPINWQVPPLEDIKAA